VLEVSGTVTIAGKQLAKDDTVVASAVIETGADGSVAIELIHNLARWELGPNKHVRVDESLAWKEPRRTEPVAAVEQDTTSAGRPAERQAAGTTTTAGFGGEDRATIRQDTTAAKQPKPDPKPDPKHDLRRGGGNTESIGLGKIGTIGHGAGTGTGQGYGNGGGRLGGSHTTSAPKIAQGDAQVSGSLPPEVTKRIVRQNFGRLRFCYESGLQKNPKLAGTVVVKFVIGRDGTVSNATAQSSTLGDATVDSCVVRAFSSFTFPAPENGIVTVTYPITFAPE